MRGVGVEAVGVEDVDVIDAHPRQGLVEARKQVLARAELAVRAGPHVPARFGGEEEFLAIRPEILGEQLPEVGLGAAVGRAVVVGEVEVADPEVERAAQDRPLRLQRSVAAEVVPQPQ